MNWNEKNYKVRTCIEIPTSELRTENQWKIQGYVPLSEDCGQMLWVNSHCQRKARYLHISEVRPMSVNEKETIRLEKQRARISRKEKNRLLDESNAKDILIKKLKLNCADIIKYVVKNNPGQKSDVQEKIDIVLDVETTGLDEWDEILQLSIIDIHGQVLYNSYLKPLYHERWDDVELINHIMPKDVAGCPTIIDEAEKIMSCLSRAGRIVGYNPAFDLNKLKRFGFDLNPDIQVYDVCEKFAEIYGEWDYKRMDFKYQKLITCAAYFDYPWEQVRAHDSLGDCMATLYCYNKIMERRENNEL